MSKYEKRYTAKLRGGYWYVLDRWHGDSVVGGQHRRDDAQRIARELNGSRAATRRVS